MFDLKKDLTAYLQDLTESEVRTLEDVIKFNNNHAAKELPPRTSKTRAFMSYHLRLEVM